MVWCGTRGVVGSGGSRYVVARQARLGAMETGGARTGLVGQSSMGGACSCLVEAGQSMAVESRLGEDWLGAARIGVVWRVGSLPGRGTLGLG